MNKMEEIKQKLKDLELALSHVCCDGVLIPKLRTVWQKLELLHEVVNNKCNIPAAVSNNKVVVCEFKDYKCLCTWCNTEFMLSKGHVCYQITDC